jgi:superfamily II DNA or RNA helicase/HKD family nuclease
MCNSVQQKPNLYNGFGFFVLLLTFFHGFYLYLNLSQKNKNYYMPTKFFTNETENTLLQKFEGIFQHRNIHFFDALIGYFRASGYFRIRPFIEKAQQIRILVGINVDYLILEAQKDGVVFEVNVEQSQEDFFKKVKKNIQEAEYSKVVEEGMTQLIADLISGKVQIKVHPKQNIHAKIYIFREKEKHAHGFGSVITGSSNLTEAGLERNFEFNVELREDADIEFASQTFEKLWAESILVSEKYVERLKKETYLNDTFSPYEVYLKFLIEYFGKSIDFDPNSAGDLPKGFKRFAYQTDAVNDGYNKMEKHGGFFLADVVGLGKTIVATQIAKKFYFKNGFPEYRSRTLIIVPPALKDGWIETVDKFGLEGYDIFTNGSIHKIVRPERYDLVIVDEAHKFRSDSSDAYNELQKICKSPTRFKSDDGTPVAKKVMLISATPLNNKPEDIANLIYLFQDSKESTLEVGNLQHFFRGKIDKYKLAKKESIQKAAEEVKNIYNDIRIKVIEPLTVRRTRTDLKVHDLYKDDLISQGVKFPEIVGPEKMFYQLSSNLDDLYDNTIILISGLVPQEYPITTTTEEIKNIKYYIKHRVLADKILVFTRASRFITYNRYRPLALLKQTKQEEKRVINFSEQLAGIMKTLLVKRIDSSFYAFKKSLDRFKDTNELMIQMYEKGKIYIAKDLPVDELLQEGKEDDLLDRILMLIPTESDARIYTPDEFEPSFYEGLINDRAIYEELIKLWDNIGDEDPKLDTFVEYLNGILFSEINSENKLVVFSESKETTEYLAKVLPKYITHRILTVDSKNRAIRMPTIRENFDANFQEDKQKNDYDIIISTEVLAEGVNLHRANIVVNYDTPWNSTRLMQRIGRVNRIGSKSKTVHIFNFFPTAKVNLDIDLEKKALMKLQAFHIALGEDSQIYTPDEEVTSFGLFDKAIDEDRDERIDYLMAIRKIKEENRELFDSIKNMPLRSRVGRKHKILRDGTITFMRNPKRDAFFYVKLDGSIEELTFLETAKQFECKPPEKGIPLHENHHQQVSIAIQHFEKTANSERKTNHSMTDPPKIGPNEKKAIDSLQKITDIPNIKKEDYNLIILAKKAISAGRFQNLQREVNKLDKIVKQEKWGLTQKLEELIKILNSYPLNSQDTTSESTELVITKPHQPDIIISESFNA